MERCKRAGRPQPALPLLLALLLLPALFPAGLAAQTVTSSLEPSGAAERLAALQEPLADADFLRAALELSGVGGRELEEALSRVRALSSEAAGLRALPVRERAEGLLELLHRRVFRQYDERQTRLHVLLGTGRFNCVSSAVLYGLLARSLGLEFRAVQTSDHAFIRVTAGAGGAAGTGGAEGWDVETTNPYGFDPGSRREFTDSFGRVTGYSYVPPGQYSRRRELGDKGLLALILYNRNAEDTEAGRYLEALQPAVDAHALRGDPESAERLLLSSLNVASFYGQAGRYEEGVAFLGRAELRLADPRLARVREDLLHNWAVSLIQAGRLEEARELIDAHRGRLSEREWRSLGVSIWQLRAAEASRRDFGEAAALLSKALESLGPDPGLVSGYEVYVHNHMAALVNSGRLEEAREVLREGLRVLPGSSLLREDESRLSARR